MKILLQSTVFYPLVGGVETVSECLANNYLALGHDCTVITRTSSSESDNRFAFKVARNLSFRQKLNIISQHDILHCNGASLELVIWAKILGKPVVWTHVGYQLTSIDGLGWHMGEASPLSPFQSFLFHYRKQGLLKASAEYAKLLLRRLVAKTLVDRHVAVTGWVAKRQPFKNQEVIYNPFPTGRFASVVEKENDEYDFFYLGRLVSEKGVATLLKAFAGFISAKPNYEKKLLVIGGGSWQENVEKLADDLGIRTKVDFVGKQTGDTLLNYVAKGKIAIIPSDWEEPMGGVALEVLAAGKPVIVSERGGLAECVQGAGLTFPNGDFKALQSQMELLVSDQFLLDKLRTEAKFQVQKFDELALTRQYVHTFHQFLNEANRPKNRILFCSRLFYPSIGGAETNAEILANEFVKLGYEVIVITETPLGTKSEKYFSFKLVRKPSAIQLLKLVSWADVFFQNGISIRQAWPLIFYKKRWVIRHFTWLYQHNLYGRINAFLKLLLNKFAVSVSVSKAIANHLRSPSCVITNPYNDQLFRLIPNVERDMELVYLGRLVSDKGVDQLLDVLSMLRSNNCFPKLSIIGTGEEEVVLKKKSVMLGLDNQVSFLGVKVAEELVQLLNRHKIMVVPSVWDEPFGVVALEGIACGCVVVGSEGGGLKQAIGDCGITYKNGDIEQLTSLLYNLLSQPQCLEEYTSNRMQHLAKHKKDLIAIQYIEVLFNNA